jgi:hypothetical protein
MALKIYDQFSCVGFVALLGIPCDADRLAMTGWMADLTGHGDDRDMEREWQRLCVALAPSLFGCISGVLNLNVVTATLDSPLLLAHRSV